MSVLEARAIPKYTLVGERERLLAMVDILAAAPREEVRALTRSAAFTRLDTRDAVLVSPEEHEERLLLLLEGRARVCEEGPAGQEMTVSLVESGTLVGRRASPPAVRRGCASRPWNRRSSAA
jgi:hypothetical protein